MEYLDKHSEVVYDMALDWQGKKLVTCEGDGVKTWERNDKNKWARVNEFKAADGPVTKAKWAHPDFGSVLAICCQHRVVYILVELKRQIMFEQDPSQAKWMSKCKLLDSKEGLEDFKFSPKH